MKDNKYLQLYDRFVEAFNKDQHKELKVQIDEDGIFIPHARRTISDILDEEIRKSMKSQWGILDDNNKSTFIDSFYDNILYKYHPRNSRPSDTVFKDIQERVKDSYHITAGTYKALQDTYDEKSKSALKQLEKSPEYPNGLLIGEFHSDQAPKKYLIERMQWLKEQGFSHLYLEHLPASLQGLVDKDFNNCKDMPHSLFVKSNYLNCSNRIHRKEYNYSDLIIAAKKAGIRVVFFETMVSYATLVTPYHQPSYHRECRLPMMNYRLYERMQEIPPSGKYIALVGGYHLTKCNDVAGIVEALGGTGVFIFDK